MATSGTGGSWIAAPGGAAISMCCGLMSRVRGEPVMRDPGRVLGAAEFLAFLAQAGQRGAHAVHLPTRCFGQIAERRAFRPLKESEDRGLLGRARRRGRLEVRSGRGSGAAGCELR